MFYSLEKYQDGSSIVFGHYSFGVIPLIAFASRIQLREFIDLLGYGLVSDIPDAFRQAFDDNEPLGGDYGHCI